jgi:peptidylprolyl isomerase
MIGNFLNPLQRPLSAGVLWAVLLASAQTPAGRPDGLYAEIRTAKGTIVARLEMDRTSMTVANFVGLAEGTIANAAFDPGRPFYDGSVYHRVVPGHVIQAGVPQSERAKNPGYRFPNEVHARLNHGRAGMLNMANSGPNTNASQWCITLGDRSYLDGDFTVFGEVVNGLEVVMRIAQGDVIESVRIVRVGARAQEFHPATNSFRAMIQAAEKRVAEHVGKKRAAEEEWVARNYPKATGPAGGVLTERLVAGAVSATGGGPLRARYRGKAVRYRGDVIGREGGPLDEIAFGSGANGAPGYIDLPDVFTVEIGKTKINPGLDAVIASMAPGERRIVIVPAESGYGRAGAYPPEIAGKRRFVISPNTLLVYDVEVIAN